MSKTQKEKRSDSNASNEVLLLWAILGEGGGKDVSRAVLDNKGMLPREDKKLRDGLQARGLIKAEGRATRNEKGRPVKGIWMSVTEVGRAWAEGNLAATVAKSQAAAPVLQAWMARLSMFLGDRNIPLTEFLGRHRASSPEADTAPSHPSPQLIARGHDTIRARIRQAYLELTSGRLNTRALLSDLREKLRDIDRQTLDEALKQMQRDEEASLYQLDNQVEVTDADRAAAIYFGGEPRHILWIER